MISAATIAVFAFAICAQLVFYVVGKRAVRARAIAASAAASGAAPTSLWAQAASSTLPVSKAEEKARAWLLSLGISVLMSATGVIKVFEGVAALVTGGLNAFSLFVLSSDMIGEMMILFFMAFMCLDIAVGLLDYSALLRWDTGYVHHTVYFLICCGLVSARWTNAFLLFGLIEVPTGILALGSIADEYRNDILFRATFFVFRLVFFGIFSILLIACTLFASPVRSRARATWLFPHAAYYPLLPAPPPFATPLPRRENIYIADVSVVFKRGYVPHHRNACEMVHRWQKEHGRGRSAGLVADDRERDGAEGNLRR